MKMILIASACVMALSGAAFAQSQPAPGASSSGNVGPGAATAPSSSTTGINNGAGMNNGMMSPNTQPSASDASNSGAPTAAGVNSLGSQAEPGAVKNGANGR
jgi:hypothetical protein